MFLKMAVTCNDHTGGQQPEYGRSAANNFILKRKKTPLKNCNIRGNVKENTFRHTGSITSGHYHYCLPENVPLDDVCDAHVAKENSVSHCRPGITG